MYYVYCPETGEELMCDTMADAERAARRILTEALMEDDNPDAEIFIFEPTRVVVGAASIKFETTKYEAKEALDSKESVDPSLPD